MVSRKEREREREREREEREREREERICLPFLVDFLLFPLLFHPGPAYEMVLPTFREGLSLS
jgi:hypothetical protein